jgi:hypothetical protein
MKSLVRTSTGKLKVVTTTTPVLLSVPTYEGAITASAEQPQPELHSPIVSQSNQPKSLPAQAATTTTVKLPQHSLTKTQLLIEMQARGGLRLSTTPFALLIAPHFKRSVDPVKHDIWDLALSHVRRLMRELVSEGLVLEEVDTSTKRVVYLYSLIKEKDPMKIALKFIEEDHNILEALSR